MKNLKHLTKQRSHCPVLAYLNLLLNRSLNLSDYPHKTVELVSFVSNMLIICPAVVILPSNLSWYPASFCIMLNRILYFTSHSAWLIDWGFWKFVWFWHLFFSELHFFFVRGKNVGTKINPPFCGQSYLQKNFSHYVRSS